MGNMFQKKTLKEIIRENERMMKKAIRELEKEISNLKNQEIKLINEIKKMAKQNQMSAVKIMAKDLVRSRKYVTRFIEMKTQLNAVSLKLQTIKSTQAMTDAMKGVTKALVVMNKKMNVPGLQKLMSEFVKENEKAEFMQEVMGETIDDAMEEEGTAAEEEAVVNQVLDELGVNVSQSVPEAPTNEAKTVVDAGKEDEKGMTDLEARLNNLKR